MRSKIGFFQILVACILLASLVTDRYIVLAEILFAGTLLQMLDNLGKAIVLREIIAVHSTFVTLFAPAIGYTYFTSENYMSRLFGRYMLVPEAQYFSFALPAMCLFLLGICWPLNHPVYTDQGPALNRILARAKAIVQYKHWTGVVLLVVGTIMFKGAYFFPETLQFFFQLLYFSAFAGFLYVYYSTGFRLRKTVMFLFGVFIVAITLDSGMFTIVAYMGLTMFSFFFLGKKAALWKKLSVFLAAAFVMVMIQLVKPSYRGYTWGGQYEGNKAALFGNLVADKFQHLNFQSMDAFFPVYYRTNQGYNITMVMRRVPAIQPHDYGTNLALAFASALVPRFLWPDKPEAGGKFNMQFYAGVTLRGWSTNIGPLGEAYGSFGVAGGIFYMFLLGLFLRWIYKGIFVISQRIPLLIYWIPVLFYQVTSSAETDTLQIMNSLSKSALYIWLLYKFIPGVFVIVKKELHRHRQHRSLAGTA